MIDEKTLKTLSEEASEIFDHPLFHVYMDALQQTMRGKGEQRHGHGTPFIDQPINTITNITGARGPFYQVIKKAQEAIDNNDRGKFTDEQSYQEILGALVYLGSIAMIYKNDR